MPENFEQYWPLYVENHKKKITRELHFWSAIIYLATWLPGFFFNFWWGIPASILFGYILAFFTHKYIEKSPYNIKHPYWGILGNTKMFFLILLGKMDQEMIRLYGKSDPAISDSLIASTSCK